MNKSYKQRFKGVENFLRRVAFNLGNTPSQTEVKIISCIPIDVTDLQNKIQQLERQLQELSKRKDAPPPPSLDAAPKSSPEPEKTDKPVKLLKNAADTDNKQKIGDKANMPTNKGATVVNTALYGESISGHTTTVSYCSDGSLRDNRPRNRPTTSGSCTSRPRKSNVVSSKMSKCRHEQPSYDFRSRDNVDPDKIENVDLDKIYTNLAAAERFYMNLFRKRKNKRVCKGKSKMKTQLVYFAHHDQRNPFNTNDMLDHLGTLNNNTVSVSHAYLENVMRKQYDPQYVVQEFSDTSHFSRPICRDTNKNFTHSRPYESDACSCCHGQFQNIDDYMPKGFESINRIINHEKNFTNKPYYDSNFYDVVPVRENTINFVKERVLPKRDIDMRCWPEQFRSKYTYGPKTVTYQAERPTKRRDKLISQKIKHQERPDKYTANQKRLKVQETIKEISASSSIEADYYHKNINQFKKSEPVKTVLFKNELTETDDINTKVLVNNQSTQLELIPNENKTESTLDQIKSILQSVLTEVKTHPKINSTLEKAPQKDAVVQKEMSQNNMLGQSTLLNSFTYNHSYNANPYLPSCSRQALISQNCLAGAAFHPSLKYIQNFPVFVHPSGRHLCACYYKKSSHKCSKCKHASMAATNTDREIQSDGKKETEKLIKEIYKSMALSMDFPTKENSVSEYGELKSTENVHISENKLKNVRSASVEVVDKRDIEVEALISSNISTQSEDTGRTIEAIHYKDSTKNQANHDRILYRLEQHNNDTILEDDEDTNADDADGAEETEDDDVDTKESETPAKMKRKGLLQRMLGSVKMLKKNKTEPNKQKDYEVEVSEASDTDDYETIYSGVTVVLPPKNLRQDHKRKTEKQRNTAKENQFLLQEKGRRSPYLEQEYRSQWHEQMMLAKQQEKKYSSEQPFSKRTPPKYDDRPIYWNNYEARSAIVEHNLPNRLNCVNSKTKLTTNLKRDSLDTVIDGGAKVKLHWAKKYEPNCGEQWKKFLLEN